jgi:hypothetical protein
MLGIIMSKPGYHFSCLVGIGRVVEVPEDVLKLVRPELPGMARMLPTGVFARVATLTGFGTSISGCAAAGLARTFSRFGSLKLQLSGDGPRAESE